MTVSRTGETLPAHPPSRARAASGVQRGLLLCRREGPDGLGAPLLAEGEAQLARRAQALRPVRAERRARLLEGQRAQRVASEVARLARDLLPCRDPLRHAFVVLPIGALSPAGRDPTKVARRVQRRFSQSARFSPERPPRAGRKCRESAPGDRGEAT